MVNLSSRMVIFLRILRIVILVRIFRLASQKKQLEVVTRRMVSWPLNVPRLLLLFPTLSPGSISGKIARLTMAYWSAIDSIAQAAHLFNVPDRALELSLYVQ